MRRVSSYSMPVTRDDLAGETGHRRNTILRLSADYPEAKTISIAERGSGDKLDLRPGEILYIMATGGKWGRSSELRIDPALIAARESREKADAEARWREVWGEAIAACGTCFALARDRYHADGAMLYERLHDCGGTFGYEVRTPAEAIAKMAELRQGHAAVYHSEGR